MYQYIRTGRSQELTLLCSPVKDTAPPPLLICDLAVPRVPVVLTSGHGSVSQVGPHPQGAETFPPPSPLTGAPESLQHHLG